MNGCEGQAATWNEPVTESEFKACLALAEGACQWAMALVTERD